MAQTKVNDDQPILATGKALIPKVSGILSIIFAFTAPIAGIVMGTIGILTHNRTNSSRNTPAVVGLVLSIITTLTVVVMSILIAMTFMQNIDSLTETCSEKGQGRHRIGAFVSVTCSSDGRILDVDF